MQISNAFGSLVSLVGMHSHCQLTLPVYHVYYNYFLHHFRETIKSYCHGTDLYLHGGLHCCLITSASVLESRSSLSNNGA